MVIHDNLMRKNAYSDSTLFFGPNLFLLKQTLRTQPISLGLIFPFNPNLPKVRRGLKKKKKSVSLPVKKLRVLCVSHFLTANKYEILNLEVLIKKYETR